MSLWNCFLTDILPTSNVIYALGDDDDHIPRRLRAENHHRDLSAPPPELQDLTAGATSLACKKYDNTQSDVVIKCPEHAKQRLHEAKQLQERPTEAEAVL